jgi:SNF2 family DNA or RNA helicase
MWRLWVSEDVAYTFEFQLRICHSLDLTAASRVHLLELQWNPSLGDQALARAHRLGQILPVTTIKYIMRNSFEEVWFRTFV